MTETAAVLVRRVPDPDRLAIDRRTGRLLVEGIPFILNPVDLSALELALRLREQHQWRIVVLSIDHTGAEQELREALAMGADRAILLNDPAFEATDPGTQASIFQAALERFVKPQIVFAAARSIDHTWSTVGPQLAYLMHWPLIIEAEEAGVEGNKLQALAHTGRHRANVEAPLPAVVTVARGVVEPRYATSWGIADAYNPGRLEIKTLSDLELPPETVAAFRAKTHVRRVTLTPHERQRRLIEGDLDDVARVVARRLIDQGWGGRRP